jgi:hypothetical protein
MAPRRTGVGNGFGVEISRLSHMDRSRRRSKKTRARGWERARQMAVLALIGSVLAVALFATGEFEFVRSLGTPALAPPNDDEVYTGSILYLPDRGQMCRQLLFDNRTGRVQDNGLVDCEQASYRGMNEASKEWSTSRAQVISESFRQH